MRRLLSAGILGMVLSASAQGVLPDTAVDTDGDGLSDALENALLSQFAPRFMISDDDCSLRPAEFVPSLDQPRIQNETGTIYGQAFPRSGGAGEVELHYYHLWRKDCGQMSHPLDAEHVSALVTHEDSGWKALYWYAAAHENTLCDASQMARAATVDGELHGPAVWISRGKHASFLKDALCDRGCGGDKCSALTPLSGSGVINLGELLHAMNGASWAGSAQWPLAVKMGRTDFPDARIARLQSLPSSNIAWADSDGHPVRGAIHVSNATFAGATTGVIATDTALVVAGSNTGDALGAASSRTGNGLAKSASGVKKALRVTAKKLGIIE